MHQQTATVDHLPKMYSQEGSETTLQQSDRWKVFHDDLLEPQFYPDPLMFRNSLQNLTRDDIELLKNLTSSKATIRVLAPYLQIMRKKIIESAAKKPRLHKPKAVSSGVFIDKKVNAQFTSVSPDISEKLEMIVSIHDTADVLQLLLQAKTVVSYLVNPARNEIFQSPRHVESTTGTLTRTIEDGTTMAAHVAFTKSYSVSENVAADPKYPLGVGFPDSLVKFALCVPIKTPDNKVVGVYELTRDAFDVPFDNKDVQLALAVTSWMGVAILQNSLYTNIIKKQEITSYLAQLTDHYHAGTVDVSKTLSDITIFARETIGAERCNLFMVKKRTKGSFTLEEYDQGMDRSMSMYKRRTKRVINSDVSTLGKVLLKKIAMKTHTVVSEVIVDGNPVRSELCVPIFSNKEPIGALQLTNKRAAKEFDQLDLETLEIFATYCSLNMTHLNLHEKLRKSELNNRIYQEMLFHHIKPCVHDQDAVKHYSSELPDQFFSFSYYPSPDDTPKLVEMTINMFHEVLGDSFMVLNNVPKFVLTVKNCYRPNPYHNYVHAFGVTHAMANIITRYHRVFTGLERKGLMVAALCHDVDHRGYNNNFLQLTQHHLVSLYESSPLENHHFAVAKLIIQQCGMFKYLTTPIYNDLLAEVYEAIIATDLSLYFQCKIELMKIAEEKTFTFVNVDHRRLVKNLMMTACDLSGQTKPLATCQKITEDVYEEFYQQGDVEKKMGYVPLPTMDREKKDFLFENQVQFLSVIVIPCMETVSRIFNTISPMVRETKELLQEWKELLQIKEESLWEPGKSLSLKPKL